MPSRSTGEDGLSPIARGGWTRRTIILQRKKLRLVGILIGLACGVFWASATGALVLFAVDWTAKRGNTSRTGGSFCCSSEAARLFAVIDSRLTPCKDVYSYICKNALEQGFIQDDVANDMLWDVSTNIFKGTHHYGTPAAAALHTLYRSCMREVWQEDLRTRDAVAIALEIANSTSRMSGADIMRFGLAVQMRYHLSFIFVVYHDPGSQTIWLTLDKSAFRAISSKSICDASCYTIALSTLNMHFGTNYTDEELFELEDKFVASKAVSASASQAEILKAFGGLEESDFNDILLDFFIDTQQLKTSRLKFKTDLLKVIRFLSDARNQPLSLCYMLLLVTMNAIRYIKQEHLLSSPTKQREKVCRTHVFKSTQLWHITYVAAFASPSKDRRLHEVFEATKRRLVEYAPLKRLVAVGNYTKQFRVFVANMSLLLPGDLVFEKPAVPHMSAQGFVRNLFVSLNFEYDAGKEKARQGISWSSDGTGDTVLERMSFVNETALYVSPRVYAWLSSGITDPQLADAAVIGTSMAALLWKNVNEWQGWPQETKKALDLHRQCVLAKSVNDYLEHPDILVALKHGLKIAAIVAAAGTSPGEAITPSSSRPRWHTMQLAWNMERMSEAQFFYTRCVYYTCSSAPIAKHLVNELMRSNADFATAFQCPQLNESSDTSDCFRITRTQI